MPILADGAREEESSYERFTEVLLFTEVASGESHGGESRIKAARFPQTPWERKGTTAPSGLMGRTFLGG